MPSIITYQVQYWKKHWAPGLMLLLGLCHGLIYVFLIPPWQHYDEPGHFEFAWLIANNGDIPGKGAYDQAMRREVAASMVENGFFKGMIFRPNLLALNEPVWIGISQIGNTPLYYCLVSLPLKLVKGADITFQLYYARLISLLLYLITIYVAYGVTAELVPPGHPLRWLVPFTLLLLPGFTDLMTAVNDDVGATAVLSIFFWVSVRMLHRGFSWLRLIGLVTLTFLCLFTKSTTAVALVLLPVTLLFSTLRGTRRQLAWYILASAGIIGGLAVLSWGDADYWHRTGFQSTPTRAFYSGAPHGTYALAQVEIPGNRPTQLFQIIPRATSQALKGKTVTLGAWIWASQPVTARTPTLSDGSLAVYQQIELGTEPAFFTLHTTLPENARQLRVILSPHITPLNAPVTIYYDGLILVDGDYTEKPPQFMDILGREGIWEGQPFKNALRNASAERAWFRIRPWIESKVSSLMPITSTLALTSIGDWPGYEAYYLTTAQNLVRTFWAKFGWAHVPLLGHKPYRFIALLTLSGIAGAAMYLYRKRDDLPTDLVLSFGMALLVTWGATLVRGVDSIPANTFYPSARYAFPVVIPTILVLCVGWLELLRYATRWTHIPPIVLQSLYWLLFLGLGIYSIVSILSFYGRV